MATQLLPVAAGAATSADIVLTSGQSATIALNDAVGPGTEHGGQVKLEISDGTGQWFEIDSLNNIKPAVVLSATGTFRVRRISNGVAIGAFRD